MQDHLRAAEALMQASHYIRGRGIGGPLQATGGWQSAATLLGPTEKHAVSSP